MTKNGQLQSAKTSFGITQNAKSYIVKRGETACKIARANGMSLKTLQSANPNVNLNSLKAGQSIMIKSAIVESSVTKTSTTNPTKKTSSSTSTPLFQAKVTSSNDLPVSFSQSAKNLSTDNIITLEKFSSNLSEEAKLLKPQIKKDEGKKIYTYIAPEGLATIGHGHLFINKPQFLTDIEKQNLDEDEKQKKVEEALKNPENRIALKASIQKDLQDAIKTTGIKNVPSTVNSNLTITDAQIELLLNSDIKKAQNAMENQIGKENLRNRTINQKRVALDLYYNVGSNLKTKAPSFVKYFKSGDIEKAQAELDIFKANGKICGGLIERNYKRMKLLNNNNITKESKNKLFVYYNKYRTAKNLPVLKTVDEVIQALERG